MSDAIKLISEMVNGIAWPSSFESQISDMRERLGKIIGDAGDDFLIDFESFSVQSVSMQWRVNACTPIKLPLSLIPDDTLAVTLNAIEIIAAAIKVEQERRYQPTPSEHTIRFESEGDA